MPATKRILAGMFLCMLWQQPARCASSHPGPVVTGASRKALEQARRDRSALLRRQADQASRIETGRKQQAQAARDAALQARRVQHFSDISDKVATEIAETEHQIAALEAEITSLKARQAVQREALARRRARFQAVLPVALRLARYPGSSFTAMTGQAPRAVQGLGIVAGLTELTARQASDLRAQQAILDETGTTLAARDATLESARTHLTRIRTEAERSKDTAAHRKQEAETRARQAQGEIAAATAQAVTLGDAISAIEKTQARIRVRMEEEAKSLARQQQADKAKAVAEQARRLTVSAGSGVSHGSGHGPVAGSILTAWHQTTESGPATGITYQAGASSPVRAPCAGQVDFAGPFRSFGNMIILDCGRHYRFVLAGLSRLDVSNGQAVGHHAILGAMASSGGPLFVQLRAGSQVIDPRPYL